MKLRGLAVGSGWGGHAARVFASDSRVQLAGIVGRGSARTTALAEQLGVPAFTDLTAAIDAIRPDITSVAAHESSNHALVKELLESGSHVLCSHPVAPTAEEVLELDALARARSLIVATDYSLRLCPAYEAAKAELRDCGAILRMTAETPGRTFVIGLDLVTDLAGPVDKVFASARYPPALRERRAQSPKAFAPTVTLEHASGSVTTIVPIPHAHPSSSYQLTVSTERATIRAALPAGRAMRFQYLGKGNFREAELAAADNAVAPAEAFGRPMRKLVLSFLESATSGVAVHAPFSREAHIRAVWQALGRSATERCLVPVDREAS